MKPGKTLVKDLHDRVGPHSIRLKVIQKDNSQTSPRNKSLYYQRIVFQDEESLNDELGSSVARKIERTLSIVQKGEQSLDTYSLFFKGGIIRTTLYNDNINAFENIIQNKMEYDISNAKIKVMPEKYRRSEDGHPYQLSFGADTIISPVEGLKPLAVQNTWPLLTFPEQSQLLIDMPLRQVPRPDGQALAVRELVVIDHSTSQPLIITAWAELATREGEQLNEVVESFPIIGFTSLKPSYHKGFSLSTTSSTFVKIQPEGEKADIIRAWNEANEVAIAAKHDQVVAARITGAARVTTKISTLRLKKASNVLQDECHWLHVSIPEFDRKHIRFYLGCSHCGTSSNKDVEVIYTCNACKRVGVSSAPRMNISFEAIDETGCLRFTAFTLDSEKMLKTQTAALYTKDPEEKKEFLDQAETRIRNGKLYIQVGPATSLSRNGALKWVLKQLSLDQTTQSAKVPHDQFGENGGCQV